MISPSSPHSKRKAKEALASCRRSAAHGRALMDRIGLNTDVAKAATIDVTGAVPIEEIDQDTPGTTTASPAKRARTAL